MRALAQARGVLLRSAAPRTVGTARAAFASRSSPITPSSDSSKPNTASHTAVTTRSISNVPAHTVDSFDHEELFVDRPSGTLFTAKPAVGPDLIGGTASIQRTFGPRSNAEGLLATGGAELAAYSSFDPNYGRAQEWIRHHAVGPARLSPILISGLIGALTEAAFPNAIVVSQSMTHRRPLIVGVPVTATIEVILVQPATRPVQNQFTGDETRADRKLGYDVTLKTVVTRVRDDAIISQGTHELFVPDYLQM